MHAKVPRDTSIGTYRHLFYCYSFLLLALLDHFVLTRHNVLVPDGEGTSGQSLERAVAATLNNGVAVRNYNRALAGSRVPLPHSRALTSLNTHGAQHTAKNFACGRRALTSRGREVGQS